MAYIKIEDILKEKYQLLLNEYYKEDKLLYENLYLNYIDKVIQERLATKDNKPMSFTTRPYLVNSNIAISIHVELFERVCLYYCTDIDLQEYGVKLLRLKPFRNLSKFCFYLMEKIKPV